MLNAVPALEDLTCELARKGRANIAEAKLRCPSNLGPSLARRSSILNRNLDSEPNMYLVYYMWADMVNIYSAAFGGVILQIQSVMW